MNTAFSQRLKDRLRQWLAPVDKIPRVPPLDERTQAVHALEGVDVEQVVAAFREAEQGAPRRLFGLYLTMTASSLGTPLSLRMIKTLGQPWGVEPLDPKNPQDVEAARLLEGNLRSTNFDMLRAHLLLACLWPLSVGRIMWKQSAPGSGLRFEFAGFEKVDHTLLTWQNGWLQREEIDEHGIPTGTFAELDPRTYIIHRTGLLPQPEMWGGLMRAACFWWLVLVNNRSWWQTFIERFGTPFPLVSYADEDEGTRRTLERAISAMGTLGGLAVKNADVKLVQANTSAGEGYAALQAEAKGELALIINGQTMASQPTATGLGSGVASLHGEVRQELAEWDAGCLASTFDKLLFPRWIQLNQLPGKVKFRSGSQPPADLAKLGTFFADLKKAGIVLAEDGVNDLSTASGFSLRLDTAVQPPGAANAALLTALAASSGTPARLGAEGLAAAGAPALARALRSSAADVSRALREANSPEEALTALSALSPDLPIGTVAGLLVRYLAAASV